jgi:sigma-B regulation protein RsbU (phosphoserine phosphatase)
MRIFPRITRPSLKPLFRKLQRLSRQLTVARVTLGGELLIFGGALLFVLTGGRADFVDRFGRRSDLIALLVLLALFALFHLFIKRRLLPRLERRFSPAPYDEHRIFFDLGQEARTAANIVQLYASIAARIGESFEAASVSIFVREEESGDYLCRVLYSLPEASQPAGREGTDEKATEQPLKFPRDAFVVKRLNSLSTPLAIQTAEFETWEQALSFASPTHRESRQQERLMLHRIKAHLLVQVRTKEKLNGILSLSLRRGQFPYTAADKEVLMSVAGQLALVIENARMAERMVAEERLRRELALAAEVQRRLLPGHPPESIAVELAGFCQPARGVGGDYYDFIRFDNQQLGIAIADVAGKGIAAALLMSTVQATLRSLSAGATAQGNANGSLADMVATLNRLLCNSTGGANYVTFFYAQYDQATQRLAYVNAGHNPPFLFRANPANDFRSLSSGGMFVGMFEHCAYEQEVVQMQPGDVLIAFTDGLPEAHNSQGEEFDEERIKAALAATAHLSVNEIRDEIVARVKEWIASAQQYDDLTFIVMKVK